jgi:RNA polymerase sigma factor (sigma-70 family)
VAALLAEDPSAGALVGARDVDALLSRHVRLVRYLARRFYRLRPGDDEEELLQLGRIGLWLGLSTWDPARGALSTHLATCAWRSMTKAFRVRANRPLPQARSLRGQSGDELDALELKEAPPEADPDAGLDAAELLRRLPRRERLAVRLRFGLGCKPLDTLDEVGEALGVSGPGGRATGSGAPTAQTELSRSRRSINWARRASAVLTLVPSRRSGQVESRPRLRCLPE